MADGARASSWCCAAVDRTLVGRLDGEHWWDAELVDREETV